MNRVWFLIGTITFALSCIWILNIFLNMEYSNHGSFDVVTGAFVEVFILTVFFEYLNARADKKADKRLEEHLNKIERLINKKG